MSANPAPLRLLADPGHFLALGCGSGLLRPAPGTWGTLAAALLWWALLAGLNLFTYLLVLLLAVGIGIWLCGRTVRALNNDDHPAIVWDEFAGFWLTCLALPPGWIWLVGAFLLFRLLDILKPWPIGWLDRRVKGGVGVMADDLVAGLMAFVVIQLLAWGLGAAGTISAI